MSLTRRGLIAAMAAAGAAGSAHPATTLRFGLFTDAHYADTDDRGTRAYRASLQKAAHAVRQFNADAVTFSIQLGDLIDALPEPTADSEQRHLARIDREMARLRAPRHHVPGNHCLWSLNREQYLSTLGRARTNEAFDAGPFRCITLDACYRADETPYGDQNNDWRDTEIPAAQRAWLAQELARTSRSVLVFIHQRLDLDRPSDHAVRSASAVRALLEQSGKVRAVFQGHSHSNELHRVGGIPYLTFQAMVERAPADSAAFSVIECAVDGAIRVHGFGSHAEHPAAIRPIT